MKIVVPWLIFIFFILDTNFESKSNKRLIISAIAILVFVLVFDVAVLERNINPFDNYRIEGTEKVDKIQCDSTVFAWYGYYKPKGDLILCFKSNGDIYMYSDVPYDVYKSFSTSDSLGKSYNKQIKGKYNSSCIHTNDEFE